MMDNWFQNFICEKRLRSVEAGQEIALKSTNKVTIGVIGLIADHSYIQSIPIEGNN